MTSSTGVIARPNPVTPQGERTCTLRPRPPRCPVLEHAAANDGEIEVFLGHATEGDWQRSSGPRGDASMGEFRGGPARLP